MYYVYIIRSISYKQKIYVGYSGNLKKRLNAHNNGDCRYTRKFRPWKIETHITFLRKETAIAFEKYLKTGSGTAFRNRRLL